MESSMYSIQKKYLVYVFIGISSIVFISYFTGDIGVVAFPGCLFEKCCYKKFPSEKRAFSMDWSSLSCLCIGPE